LSDENCDLLADDSNASNDIDSIFIIC